MEIRYATQGVILDTNVFMVFLIGLWDSRKISTFKRTASYTEGDFQELAEIVRLVGKLVTTPHILTEVCNLTDTLNKQHGFQVYQALAHLQNGAKERRQEAKALMADSLFQAMGIADMSLIEASQKNHLIITDEAECYATIARANGLVINLNHLRGQTWLRK